MTCFFKVLITTMDFTISSDIWSRPKKGKNTLCGIKVIIDMSHGEVSLMEQDTIENVF